MLEMEKTFERNYCLRSFRAKMMEIYHIVFACDIVVAVV